MQVFFCCQAYRGEGLMDVFTVAGINTILEKFFYHKYATIICDFCKLPEGRGLEMFATEVCAEFCVVQKRNI